MHTSPARTSGGNVRSPTGHTIPALPVGAPRRELRPRELDGRAIRRQLPAAWSPEEDTCLQIITDLSGSMYGGNDALGLRHEAALIVLEHLASARHGRGRWSVELRSFDLASAFDAPRTEVTRRKVRSLRDHLLAIPGGGSSSLDASLADAEAASDDGPRRILVVLSDFELFDPPGVLDRLASSRAARVVACVFRSPVPESLRADPRVVTHHVDPSTADAATLAFILVQELRALDGVVAGP